MEGPVRRRRGLGSRLALVTSLFMISSLFVIVGAQVASAQTCSDGITICHLEFRFQNPAGSEPPYTDSSPQRAAVGETITSADLDPSGPPVIVEVEFEDGNRDTSYVGEISVALIGSGMLSGDLSVPAEAGAAFFRHLSIDTKGKDFQLTATATEDNITSIPSGTFRIEGDRCARGETCTDSLPVPKTLSPAPSQTLMIASLTNGGTGVVALSVGIDGLDPSFTPEDHSDEFRSCSTPTFVDPFFHAPAESTVDEVRAAGNGTKVLQLRIGKTWRQMVLDRGIQSYRPCITAPVHFTTWNGSPITETAPNEFTGLAPDCSKTITTFCRAFVKSNKSGDVLEGITFPAGDIIAGDPKVH
jgi:hypothetical protein